MKKYNVGIIGFGFIGKVHAYGYKSLPFYYSQQPYSVNLSGVCTSSLETAQKAKDTYGFEFGTANPDDILENEDIDIVNICTPNAFHKDAVLKAISKGKHIYCEKPLTVSFEEAQEIVSAIRESNTKLDSKGERRLANQITFHIRFFSAILRAKELIDEGRLGRILSFRASYLNPVLANPKWPFAWRMDSERSGGGAVFDIGSHVLDLIYYLMGEYESLSAYTMTAFKERPDVQGVIHTVNTDDAGYMIAKMKCGAVGTVEASKLATGANDELRIEIHGEKGALRFNMMDLNWLEFFDATKPEAKYGGERGFTKIECLQRYNEGFNFPNSKAPGGWLRAHIHSIHSFMECIHEGRQCCPSLEDGAYIQRVISKVYESANSLRWVDID